MPQLSLPVTLLALLAPVAVHADAQVQRVQMGQITIRERLIIRVPRIPPAKPIVWKERKGPKCIAAQTLAGALVSAPNQVDLVLQGGKRVRAKLDGDCHPLDFYSGFYIRPSADGMVCADRDAIQMRSGAACGIDQFRLLKASK